MAGMEVRVRGPAAEGTAAGREAVRVADQAAGLRRMAGALRAEIAESLRREAAGRGVRIVAVTSGKGGVGKTSLAVNLAVALRTSRRPVLLIDADVGLANAALLLGARPARHLGDVLAGRCLPAEAVCEAGGVRLLCGGSALEELADLPGHLLAEVVAWLPRLAGPGEVVLVDTAAGLGSRVRAVLRAAPEVVLVATPEPTSLADAYATLKLLARENPHAPVHLLINQGRDADQAERAFAALRRMAARLPLRELGSLGWVPTDPAVARGALEGRPFVAAEPDAPAAGAVRSAAARLLLARPGEGWGGFLRRLGAGRLGRFPRPAGRGPGGG